MICAVRPGAKYFEETVSTLKYADRAKQIKNKAVVNENGQDKLIRELKLENERLAKLMANGGNPADQPSADSEEEKQKLLDLEAEVERNKKAMADMDKSWDTKLAEATAL